MQIENPRELVARYLPPWAMRLTLGAAFFVLGELALWDDPAPGDWPRRALGCVVLAAVALDLIARFNVDDIPGLMLAGGIFGVSYGVLVLQPSGDDLVRVIVTRPLGWYSLAGGGLGLALARWLWRGAAFSWVRAAAVAGLGLLWGIWVHWFPALLDDGEPAQLAAALAVMAAALAALGALAYASYRWVPRVHDPARLLLTRAEMAAVGAVLATFLGAGILEETITVLSLSAMLALVGFMGGVLYVLRARRRRSMMARLLPPKPFNVQHFAALALIFLLAAAAGHSIPAIGDEAEPLQIQALTTALLLAGAFWLPAAGIKLAMDVFGDLSRQGF